MATPVVSASTERWTSANGFGACEWWLLSTSTGLLPLAVVIATALGILPHRSSWAGGRNAAEDVARDPRDALSDGPISH
ncbi:hypothetical protein [Mycobacterium branderi]|nr:hypothetical protein [Mycobacterium branderi]MCV7233144.1 hypothetical protein [Mycobacterium branderi]